MQGKYEQAAATFRDCGATEQAVAMFRELRMFDRAAFWSAKETGTSGSSAAACSADDAVAAADRHIAVRCPRTLKNRYVDIICFNQRICKNACDEWQEV